MVYPVWEGVGIHSTMFVAFIAAFHVIASHLTVGAAWFNLYLERRAVHEDRPDLYLYLKRSALGLLVFSYVYGAMTGVGIWQSTTAGNPRGISTLIHNFVLFWGSEWYMFMIDVVGIIVYYYTFGRTDKHTHLRIAWILALGGTGTLSLIVGILGFKLTPGQWLETGEPLHGFYNPTFWPQILLRFSMMQAITGVYGIFVASTLPRSIAERQKIIRHAGVFGLTGMVISVTIVRYWYYNELPERSLDILGTPALPAITFDIIYAGLVIVALAFLFSIWKPQLQTTVGTLAVIAVLFAAVFGAERTREILRKPDIVNGYMSSNGLIFNDLPARDIENEEAVLNAEGMAGTLPFVIPLAEIDVSGNDDYPTAEVAFGRGLVAQQCASCHSVSEQTVIEIGGSQLALRSQAELLHTRGLTTAEVIEPYLGALGNLPYMHEVVGTPDEIHAIAVYLEHEVAQRYGAPEPTPEVAATATNEGSH